MNQLSIDRRISRCVKKMNAANVMFQHLDHAREAHERYHSIFENLFTNAVEHEIHTGSVLLDATGVVQTHFPPRGKHYRDAINWLKEELLYWKIWNSEQKTAASDQARFYEAKMKYVREKIGLLRIQKQTEQYVA